MEKSGIRASEAGCRVEVILHIARAVAAGTWMNCRLFVDLPHTGISEYWNPSLATKQRFPRPLHLIAHLERLLTLLPPRAAQMSGVTMARHLFTSAEDLIQ